MKSSSSSSDRIWLIRDNEPMRPGYKILLSGGAGKLVEHADGRSAAAELFAAPAVLRPETNLSRFIAIGESIVVPHSHRRREAPILDRLLSEQAALHQVWVEILLFEQVRARVAYLMLLLSSAYPSGSVIPAKLNYSRLASLCGVTQRSVDRCVGEWGRSGVLSRRSEGYQILDPASLKESLGESGYAVDFLGSQARRLRLIRRLSGMESLRRVTS